MVAAAVAVAVAGAAVLLLALLALALALLAPVLAAGGSTPPGKEPMEPIEPRRPPSEPSEGSRPLCSACVMPPKPLPAEGRLFISVCGCAICVFGSAAAAGFNRAVFQPRDLAGLEMTRGSKISRSRSVLD
jgi:hypothetical protein